MRGIGSLNVPRSRASASCSFKRLSATFLRFSELHGCPHWDRTIVNVNTMTAKRNTGCDNRRRLSPAARIATSSLSKDKRPKAVIEAIRPAIGRVNTKPDGKSITMTLRTDQSPTPFETNNSTRRKSSRVSMTKQSAPRLKPKGESSSVKM